MPGRAVVGGDFHAGDHSAAGVGGGAGDRHLAAVLEGFARFRRGDRRGRRRSCRSTCSPATRPEISDPGWAPMSANRLTVACSMLGSGGLRWVGGAIPGVQLARPQDHCTVPAPKTSAPLGARYSVRWCVAGGVFVELGAVVGERLQAADRWSRRGRTRPPAGSRCRRPHPTRSRACRSPGRASASAPAAGLATAVLRHRRSLLYCEGTVIRAVPELTTKCWPVRAFCGRAAVRRRAAARIAPGPGPRRRILGIDRAFEMRLLVGDQRPVGRVRAVDARSPARLPEHLVAAEEREVDACFARRFARSRAGPPTSTRRGRWR